MDDLVNLTETITTNADGSKNVTRSVQLPVDAYKRMTTSPTQAYQAFHENFYHRWWPGYKNAQNLFATQERTWHAENMDTLTNQIEAKEQLVEDMKQHRVRNSMHNDEQHEKAIRDELAQLDDLVTERQRKYDERYTTPKSDLYRTAQQERAVHFLRNYCEANPPPVPPAGLRIPDNLAPRTLQAVAVSCFLLDMTCPILIEYDGLAYDSVEFPFPDEGIKQLMHFSFRENDNRHALKCEQPQQLTQYVEWTSNQLEFQPQQMLDTTHSPQNI